MRKRFEMKKEFVSECEYGKCWRMGPFFVIVANEPNIGWHISISHRTRWPIFSEIKKIKYEFLPDVDMYMAFPPKDEYVNLCNNCFHLWEITERVKK